MKRRDWLILLCCVVGLVLSAYSHETSRKCETILKNKQWAILSLTDTVDIINKENTLLSAQLDQLTAQVRLLQESKQDKADRSGERGERRIMEVTAYWEGSCNKAPDDPEYGITASGEYVQDGFIAAGPELKIGQKVYIPYFDRTFTVMDRGKDITNGHLDIYMRTAKACFEFGRVKQMEVYVMD